MRRRWKLLLGTVASLGVAAATTGLWLPAVTRLAEPTIRAQILSIAGDLLKPRIEVGHLEYRYPFGVDIVDLELVATRPDGRETTILDADRVGIELDRLPIVGPLVFRDFTLEGTSVRLDVAHDGTLIGWGDLLTGDDSAGEDERPISEIFAIDLIEVKDLGIEYSIEGDARSMTLDQLDFQIDNQGRKGDQRIDLGKGPGWYAIDTTLKRADLFDITLVAGIDIDTLDVDLTRLDVDVRVDKDSIQHLPPQVQSFVVERDVVGRVDASVSGSLNLRDPRRDDTRFAVDLRPTRFAFDDTIFAIDKARIEGRYESEVLVVDPCRIDLFGGQVNLTLRMADEITRGLPGESGDERDAVRSARASEQADVQAKVAAVREFSDGYLPDAAFDKVLDVAAGVHAFAAIEIRDIQLADIHRTNGDDAEKIAGLVDSSVELDFNVGRPLKTLGGGGEGSITDGRFTGGAAVKALAGLMRIMTLRPTQKDEAQVSFLLRDEQIEISSLSMLAGPIGARGRGTIGFDGSLDLRINAGPLEGLQATTGKLGEVFGMITDRLAKYLVRGRIGDPKVSVAPLGIDLFGR